MFHSGEKKEVIKEVKEKAEDLHRRQNIIIDRSNDLYSSRTVLQSSINSIWTYLNSIRNTPKFLDTTIQKIKYEYGRYDGLLNQVKVNANNNAESLAGGSAAAGVAAGVAQRHDKIWLLF